MRHQKPRDRELGGHRRFGDRIPKFLIAPLGRAPVKAPFFQVIKDNSPNPDRLSKTRTNRLPSDGICFRLSGIVAHKDLQALVHQAAFIFISDSAGTEGMPSASITYPFGTSAS